MTALSAAPPRRRLGAVSAVLLGHMAVLLLVWQERSARPQGSELRRSITLKLVPERPRQPPPEREAPRPAAQPAPRVALPSVQSSAEPEGERSSTLVPTAPTAPAVDGTGPPAASMAGTAAAPGPSASGAPLALTPSREVLRGSLVNPAINDPRSHTPKPTFEERIAMGADPELCVKLERLPDGTVKRSMGRMGRATSLLQATHGVGAKEPRVCL